MMSKLLTRSVQRIGYSYFISLPLEWIEHHKLSHGDKIVFNYDDDNFLIAKPEKTYTDLNHLPYKEAELLRNLRYIIKKYNESTEGESK